MKFGTKAIHVGQKPDPTTGAIIPPIFMTSTYALEAPDKTKGFDYTRHGNPNFSHLEETLAALEGGKHATVFSSGIAGLSAVVATLSKGDRVVALKEVYGGTYRLFTDTFQKFGITFELVDDQDLEKVTALLKPPTRLLLFETPTNPLLQIMDIQAFCQMAKKEEILVMVDNTFASPYYQNPLALGADITWHSTTKYIGGHSDLIGGALITNHLGLKEKFDLERLTLGLNPSPFDAWLTSRGVKTLPLRMEQHSKNAMALATFLSKHPRVKAIHYPGLPDDPGHAIAKKQMRGFSGMFSAEFDFSLEETKKRISSFRYFSLGISLGGVESLVNHSATMSHVAVPKKEREKMGIRDGLVRFSAGIEETEDLLEDLEKVLN